MKNKILPPPILMPCEVKGSFTVSPTSYTFKPTDKIVINYSHTSKLDYGYLYGLTDDVVFSESSTTNTITFPSNSKEGSYNCYIGTYENATDWIESNRFTITIGNSTPPPTDNAPTVNSISDIATKVNQTVAITYIATDDNGIVKHELSQNGGSSFSAINPTKNGNTYTHTLSYSSVGNRQCKIRVTDAKNQSATSNNFTISVTDSTPSDIPVTSVVVSPTSKSLTVGASFNITHTVNPNNATNKNVTWSSSNTNVASVVNGLVRGIAKGSATITCRSASDSSKYATCSVTVTDNSSGSGLQAIWNNYTSSLQALRESMHNANTKIAQVKADNSTETSKTYTEAKIEVVSNAIKEKVSQTTYDENNKIVNSKITEVEKTVDGINSNVETIQGDYVKGSQLKQLDDKFEFGISTSGANNLVNNTQFTQGDTYWTFDRTAYYYHFHLWDDETGGGIANKATTIASMKQTNIPVRENAYYCFRMDAVIENNVKGGTININFMGIGGSKLGSVSSKIVYGENFFDFKTVPGTKWCDLVIDHEGCKVADGAGFVLWVNKIQICSEKGIKAFRPNPNEIMDGVTTIDRYGVKIKHEVGSYTRINASELFQANERGDKTLAMRMGGLRLYEFTNDDGIPANGFLGGLTSTYQNGENACYGNALYTSGNGGFLDIGFAGSTQDEMPVGLIPFIRCVKDESKTSYRKGNNFIQDTYCHASLSFPYAPKDPRISYISKVNGVSDQYKGINISGTNRVMMSVQCEPYEVIGHMIQRYDSYPHKIYHETKGDWYMNYATLYNATIAGSLNNPIAPYGSKERSFTRRTTGIMSTVNIIEDRGEDTTLNGSCIIEIPSDIKYNISKYDVNIIKYGRGDIWVSERHEDYFVVESDNDIKFTWVLEGHAIEKEHTISYDVVESEDSPIDISTNPSSMYALMNDEDIDNLVYTEELKMNNELWKMYRARN